MVAFSVIIPTYGRPEFLNEAIASVLAQTVEDFEIVVVDDGSPDPIDVPDDPRIRVVRRPNGGPGAARNTGVAEATGDYLVFCDDDDLFTSERLRWASRGLERAPIAVCWQRWLHESDTDPRGRILEGSVHDQIADRVTPSLGATAIQRDAFTNFREDFLCAEDIDWWIRITRGHPVTTVRKVGYLVRRHDGPRPVTGVTQRIADSMRLLEIHEDYFESHPAAASLRWKRIGLMARRVGDLPLARRSFVRALRLNPTLADSAHLVRTVAASVRNSR